GALRRPGRTVPALSGTPVEPDCRGEPVPTCGRQPGVTAAEAEADGEDRSGVLRAEVADSRADIRLNTVGSRLFDVRHVLEIVAALRDPGGATEVVECHGRDASLGKPQRQFLVEPV